jgi:hypothetical protein
MMNRLNKQAVVYPDGKVNGMELNEFLKSIDRKSTKQQPLTPYTDPANETVSAKKQSEINELNNEISNLNSQLTKEEFNSEKAFMIQNEIDRLSKYVSELQQSEFVADDIETDSIYKVELVDDPQMIESANPYLANYQPGDDLFVAKAGDFYVSLPINEQNGYVMDQIIPKNIVDEVDETYTFYDGAELENGSVNEMISSITYNYERYNSIVNKSIQELQSTK